MALFKREPIELKYSAKRHIKLIEEAPLGLEDRVDLLLVFCDKKPAAEISFRINYAYDRKSKTYLIPEEVKTEYKILMSTILDTLGLSRLIAPMVKGNGNLIELKCGEHVKAYYEIIKGVVSKDMDYIDAYKDVIFSEIRRRDQGHKDDHVPHVEKVISGVDFTIYHPLKVLAFPFMNKKRKEDFIETERALRIVEQVSPKMYQEIVEKHKYPSYFHTIMVTPPEDEVLEQKIYDAVPGLVFEHGNVKLLRAIVEGEHKVQMEMPWGANYTLGEYETRTLAQIGYHHLINNLDYGYQLKLGTNGKAELVKLK